MYTLFIHNEYIQGVSFKIINSILLNSKKQVFFSRKNIRHFVSTFLAINIQNLIPPARVPRKLGVV